ncbi:hypothetical protein MWN33_12985 [Starkeya koreensis]|uniref:Uncharacterized protein n=1 Tax=Ancylobacter koreensis TaxID=266121 RepID=A0ABT0DP26_9HYPH|nr:hypothetical protein [Ancylobacter koreensis]MCK0208944.1 hypothetical protein [Ancylobacter koreensis]
MPTADRSHEESAERVPGRFRNAETGGARADATHTGSSRTPWPGGRRRNWRAALMLAGAALLMAAGLSLWSVIGP